MLIKDCFSFQIIVLNGVDGSPLWNFEGGSFSYSSDLSLKTSENNMDAFLVKIIGRNASKAIVKEVYSEDFKVSFNFRRIGISKIIKKFLVTTKWTEQ